MTSGDAWQPYDPTWLVVLAREQLPEEAWLPDALAACTRVRRRSEAYIYFIDPDAWQHETCLELDSPTEGALVLDILKGGRVGGVEFLDRV